jgi:hypothetical protein
MAELSGQVPGHLSKSSLDGITRKNDDVPIMMLLIANGTELYKGSGVG